MLPYFSANPKIAASSLIISVLLSLPVSALSQAVDESAHKNFAACKLELKSEAQAEGFSEHITDRIIPALAPIERVIKLDRKQPEFTESFGGYLKKRLTDARIETGKRMLHEHKELLQRLTKTYGIPARYLVAFWGLETNFGSFKGKISTLDALATLACDPRRAQYFTQELFNLFHLIDQNQVAPKQLQGSWAGAMGHMQFMPTALKTYGVDGDGDGVLDVWDSIPDALTSAANYLNAIGWNQEEIWGRRVLLPRNFAFPNVEFDRFYPLKHFEGLNVTKTYSRPLPKVDIRAQLVLPAGRNGPAFLVYRNYFIIMKWNFSQSYALSVGLLADRLIGITHGLEDISTEPYDFSPIQLKALQEALNEKNYDAGKPDGIWGPGTRKALRQFQLDNGLPGDGFPDHKVFSLLKIQ